MRQSPLYLEFTGSSDEAQNRKVEENYFEFGPESNEHESKGGGNGRGGWLHSL